MAYTLTLQAAPRIELRPTAALVAYAQLLSAGAREVERLVERELHENPALERADAMPGAGPAAPPREPIDEPGTLGALALDARLSLPARDHAALDFVLGSLDDHGFLTVEPATIAAAVGASLDRVERVLTLVRELGPVGIGSRDVRACLDLQLARLRDDPALIALARRIVAGPLADLAAGRYGALAAQLGAERAQVVAACELIRERLRPFPVLDVPLRGGSYEPRSCPEVVITQSRRDPERLHVELPEQHRCELRVSPSYVSLAAADPNADADVRRGRTFIRRLGERWSTIRRVTEATARDQRAFVLEGPAALHPLTRGHVAARLGLHESTVSRAVAGRSALLPCGRVVPLSAFFTPSLTAQAALRELIAREPRPLSDDELATALTADGHPVARRTVAKYRALLDIPPSTRRETRFAPRTGAANAPSALAAPAR